MRIKIVGKERSQLQDHIEFINCGKKHDDDDAKMRRCEDARLGINTLKRQTLMRNWENK